MTSKRLSILLWLGCIIGSWSIIPYALYSNIIPPEVSLSKLLLLTTMQALVLYGVLVWVAYRILPKTDLHPFKTETPTTRIFLPAVLSGILIGFTIFALEKTLFFNSAASRVHPPFWTGLLASIYGAINEEVLLRLFLFTFVYFLLIKIFKRSTRQRIYLLWATNILVAFVFGLGHLPALFKIVPPTGFEIFRVLLLNGIPGLVFGWLYWARGFYAAMLAHFVTDLMIHAFLI